MASFLSLGASLGGTPGQPVTPVVLDAMENNTAVGEEVASAVGILHVNVMLSGAVITSATTTVLTPIQNGGNRVGNTRGGERLLCRLRILLIRAQVVTH